MPKTLSMAAITSPDDLEWVRTPVTSLDVNGTATWETRDEGLIVNDKIYLFFGGKPLKVTPPTGRDDTQPWKATNITPPTGWDLTVKVGPADQKHTFASITLRADNTAPTIVVTAPANGASFTGNSSGYTVHASGSVSDSQSGVQSLWWSLENGHSGVISVNNDGSWSVDIPIPLGAHVITVKAQDTVGNAASVPTSITVQASAGAGPTETGVHLTYDFENFFHPFVGVLIKKLNEDSLAGMMNPNWLDGLKTPDPVTQQQDDFFFKTYGPVTNAEISVTSYRKQIELGTGEPYSNYNWELFFHVPLTVATHLSKTQRFAEAQRWFHYIFDPTSNDQTTEPPKRFWKFLGFRSDHSEHSNRPVTCSLEQVPGRPFRCGKTTAAGLAQRVPGDSQSSLSTARGGAHAASRLPVQRGDEVLGQPDFLGRQSFSAGHTGGHQRSDATLRFGGQYSGAAPGAHSAQRHGAAEDVCGSEDAASRCDGQCAGQVGRTISVPAIFARNGSVHRRYNRRYFWHGPDVVLLRSTQ